MAKTVTNDRLYDAIEAVRLELKADIKAVDAKVDKVDGKVNSVMTAQAVDKTKLGVIVAGITVTVSAVVTVILSRVMGKA